MKIKYNFWQNWKNVFFLFLFYLSAHFLLIFSRVVMWDGWLWLHLLKQKDYETLWKLFSQTSLVHVYAVYRVIDSFGNPITISNFLVFISWFIAGLCVYLIFKNFTGLGEKNSFFSAAIFLLVPIFIVRFEISMLTYSLTNALFFLGSYVFLRAATLAHPFKRLSLQILAASFFISAFFTASFLVFYGALILFAFFLFLKKGSLSRTLASKRLIAAIFIFFKKNIFWFLLPFIFYITRNKIIGAPYGLYEGYNSFVFSYSGITFFGFLSIVLDRIFQFVVYGFFWPIISSISILHRKIFFAIFLFFLASIYFFDKKFNVLTVSAKDDLNQDDLPSKNIFIWGILLFIFAFLAYVLVGESPNPYGSGFDMRHGLILPLGFSLIILSFINGLLNKKIQKMVKIIVLAVFITYNIYNYYTLDMDWYKQIGIIENLREKGLSEQIGERDIFVFYDRLPLYRYRGRSIKDHEYTAYLYEATGNSKLMGTSVNENLSFMSAVKKDELDFKDEQTRKRFKNIVIRSDAGSEPTVKNWLQLKVTDWFRGKGELASAVKRLIGINVEINVETPKEISWFEGLSLKDEK